MLRRLLIAIIFLPALGVWAGERQVVLLEDPIRDDDGNGTLVYPLRQDYQPGDLDLVSLRIVHDDAVYRFEAKFRNPINDPGSVSGDVGPESLSQFARHGFYTFNIDIYIDQDRIFGSGNTYTLPGRHVNIDASHAWEKAIILTPRPELMRKQLVDAVAESAGRGERESDPDEVAKRIDRSIFFPNDIRVRNRTITFNVPDSFLIGGRPDSDWSISAFVTGAKTSIEANINLFSTSGNSIDRIPLGVLQPKSGRPQNTFGYTSVTAPSPVVDLLNPLPHKQQMLLSGSNSLVGVSWSTKTEKANKIEIGHPVTSIINSLSTLPESPPDIQDSTSSMKRSIANRLRQLNDLYKQKLVNEEEYKELRRKILSDL